MIDYLEILERANEGEYITEENWDLDKGSHHSQEAGQKVPAGMGPQPGGQRRPIPGGCHLPGWL